MVTYPEISKVRLSVALAQVILSGYNIARLGDTFGSYAIFPIADKEARS